MIIDDNNIYPSEGFKYITNGEVWSDWVILGIYDSPDNWHDTNEEPPEEGEAEIADYQEALNELGVETDE